MSFGSRYQPGDSWQSNIQREHSEKRKLPQNQVSECGSIILRSVVLYALIVWLHYDVGILGDKYRCQARVLTRTLLASQLDILLLKY